jgi:putative ABC transport system permease protein
MADASATLLARPWRTLASAIGVVVGVASGVVTLSLAASQATAVERNFDRQLSPLVILEPAPSATGSSRTGPAPMRLLTRQLREVPGPQTGGEMSTWRRKANVTVSAATPGVAAPLFGADADGLAAAGARDLTGSLGLLDHLVASGPIAWIGEDLAKSLAIDRADANGSTVRVDGIELSIAGVITEGARYPALGRSVVVSPALARDRWGSADQERIIVMVRRGSAAAVARHLTVGLDPAGMNPVIDVTPPDGAITRDKVGADLTRAGIALSLVALAIGIISVASVLTTSVIQRTREIGLRAALGWSVARLACLILTEAILLGAFAAILGTAAGALVATGLCERNGWLTVIPPIAAWLPLLLGIVAGGVGGLPPAIRAGRVAPTEALRG